MRVRVLPEDVANKIAAGEVVERPASVVKELIENAIDAGATEVRVELTEGGKRSIRVSDNGEGMTPEDAELALKRHATSKLASADDLASIETLGFRGEALPSIASVSRFELVTRTPDAIEGYRIVVEGGRLQEKGPTGCPIGTRITVSNLFYNVPARLKFLKKETTELNHAIHHVQWAALAHPSIRFVLEHNRRTLIDVPGCETRLERVRFLYGRELAEHLLVFTKTFQTFEIECLIGDASLSKPNRSFQHFFVNDRPIRDKNISAALARAMEEVTPKGRHPVAFLFLRMPPTEVDVNVHPAKAEVRFRNERAVFRNILQAIAQGIAEKGYVPDAKLTQEDAASPLPRPYPMPPSRSIVPPTRTSYGSSGRARRDLPRADETERIAPSIPRRESPAREAVSSTPFESRDEAGTPSLPAIPTLELLGTAFDTYLLAADAENLYFIDQHVASERVHYERIITQLRTERVASQGLLAPISVELNPAQQARFEAHHAWLERFGLDVEAFGGSTVLIRAIPASLEPGQAARMFLDLLDRIDTDLDPERSWEEIQERAAATVACHSAVRAGDRLSSEAQRALLHDLAACRLPFNCPHGRPILVRMRRAEIERFFQRR